MFFKDTNDLNTQSDIVKNHTAMRKIERRMSLFTKLYAFTCIPYAVISLFMIILSVGNDTLSTFIDGVIIKGAAFAAGFLGCYKHDIRLSWAAAGCQLLAVLFSGFTYFDSFLGIVGVDLNAAFLGLFIFIAIANTGYFRMYTYLETQPGFPQFSEQFEIQKENRRKFEENNPFEEQMKRYTQNSSGSMNELDTTVRSSDNGSQDNRAPGFMDEI